ncbi:MAG TPA: ChaN family lipoprotein, partial [Polyangiales bacterium]
DSMVLVQRARDAQLAERLHARSVPGQGAVLIAGTGHVRNDRGVPAALQRAFATHSLTVGLIEVHGQWTTMPRYAEEFDVAALPFDYVWFTPRASDEDHCAELRTQMAHKSS